MSRESPGRDFAVEGKFVPRGATVIGELQLASVNPSAFPQPTEFRPERFLGESQEAASARDKYLSFGRGARACAGQAMALAIIKASVAILLQRYSVELERADEPGSFEVVCGVARPDPGFHVVFSRRESGSAM